MGQLWDICENKCFTNFECKKSEIYFEVINIYQLVTNNLDKVDNYVWTFVTFFQNKDVFTGNFLQQIGFFPTNR
jgi:hypothetical protein